jgi:hypothetical protein
MRPSFLDYVSASEPREAEARDRTGVMTFGYVLDNGDDEPDEDDDEFDDDDNEDDEDDEDEEEEETWQVRNATFPKGQPFLDFGLRTA